MRWLIALLLTANVMAALWLGMERQGDGQLARLPEPDIGDLQLLVDESSVAGEAVAEHEPPMTHADIDVPAMETEERTVGPAPSDTAGDGRLADEGGEPEPEVADELPASPVAAATAVGMQNVKPLADEAEPKVAATGDTRQGARQACWELGPFEQASEAERLQLPTGIQRLKIGRSRVRVPAGFYVLVPPAANREAARQTVERLKAKGVRDSWLFASGPLRNAISLGMFSQQENAMRRKRQIEKMGFAVRLQRRERVVEGHVVMVKGLDIPANVRLLDRLAAGQLRRVKCP
ncbi:hypothetical protein [endosymbiont of unidentified scaly snail isolate Monju]|uniref:hypothetical protein n=1 Tax=endosymbiont of unidentified scaly snail isolate Monju TaxID=1248727 RepID=UPI0003891E25|nr:hypothetical protein [endosymbiont of unidentified scaly snail isolate Monju]BAN69889.1 hypothetical protein EBS_2029 [endosymbiont of unidentified scaly snail isolate Monju]